MIDILFTFPSTVVNQDKDLEIKKSKLSSAYNHKYSFDDLAKYIRSSSTLSGVVKSGFLEFRFENGAMMGIVKYNADRKLSKTELKELKQYTKGQLVDGMFENMKPFLVNMEHHLYYFDVDDMK